MTYYIISGLENKMSNTNIDLTAVAVERPEGVNVIIGTSHFIKSVEDLHETLVTSVPGIKFGLAFCEASGPRLIRWSGTDDELISLASQNAKAIGCGHSFIIMLKDTFPINVLNAIKNVQEVCCIHCATANKLEVIVAETASGRGIIGVVDGESPLGIEKPKDQNERKAFLRTIGYKS